MPSKNKTLWSRPHKPRRAVTAGGFRLAGLPLSDWLVLASIAFVALQAAYLVWKWRRDYVHEQARQELRDRAKAAVGGTP
ncbi:hypothetical protein [Comamonas sp. E6]|uniref:hypothetical protein n=1 Tax=Comamonas sp. E6 TaxID=364029 RepID=UPI00062E9257|nr:hypothetical protein [Comamonas sp. E6]GAO73275.1 hypothetical protein CSE6_034_47120 [Comamonas sp. E6]